MAEVLVKNFDQIPAGINQIHDDLNDLRSRFLQVEEKLNSDNTVIREAKLYTREEVAKILHLSLHTLNEYTKAGKIKAYRIGWRVLYKEQDVDAALVAINAARD